jgi:hypothetical protein
MLDVTYITRMKELALRNGSRMTRKTNAILNSVPLTREIRL